MAKTLPVALFLLCLPVQAWAQFDVRGEMQKRQAERQKTRWTLSEWLATKERIKAMDTWLAVFSDPKKDHFRADFLLAYRFSLGKSNFSQPDEPVSYHGQEAYGEFWLLNFLSSAFQLRLPNVDVGVAGAFQERKFSSSPLRDFFAARGAWWGNFRLLGSSTQDSALTFSLGKYVHESRLTHSLFAERKSTKGIYVGGELQIYLFPGLALQGRYGNYGQAFKPYATVRGESFYGGAGIDVGSLRLEGGKMWETWHYDQESAGSLKEKTSPYLLGLVLCL